jgi:hypothetical protein
MLHYIRTFWTMLANGNTKLTPPVLSLTQKYLLFSCFLSIVSVWVASIVPYKKACQIQQTKEIHGERLFCSQGTYASFISNALLIYLKILKNLKQKCFVYVSMFYEHAKLFQQKPSFYMAYLKMIKFGTKIGLSTTYVFFFFA